MKSRKQEQKNKKSNNKKNKAVVWKWHIVFASCSAFLFLFSLMMTLVLHPDYVRMSADLNPFVTTSEFFRESMLQAGGLLAYSSRFLQSMFYVPALGNSLSNSYHIQKNESLPKSLPKSIFH